jgi:hypothetical protein
MHCSYIPASNFKLRACKLHLLGIRECRWTGCGKRITSTGETIAYSGRNDEKQYGRVAIIMNRHVTKAVWLSLTSFMLADVCWYSDLSR